MTACFNPTRTVYFAEAATLNDLMTPLAITVGMPFRHGKREHFVMVDSHVVADQQKAM